MYCTNVNQIQSTNGEGSITVTNFGHYLGSFGVTFFYEGDYITLSSGILTAYPSTIKIPAVATDIVFDATGYVDLSESYTIYQERFSTPPTKCYILWGVPFNWGCRTIPCPPNNSNQNQPCCCNCCCNCCKSC